MTEYYEIDFKSALWFEGFESFQRLKTGIFARGVRSCGGGFHGVVVCTLGSGVNFVLDLGSPVEASALIRKFSSKEDVDYLNGLVDSFFESGPHVGAEINSFTTSIAVDSLSRVVAVLKTVCNDCRFSVSVPQHSQRCKVVDPSVLHSVVDRVRRLAWLGDALHISDVRCYLLSECASSSELQLRLQSFCSTAAQANWYKRAVNDLRVTPYVKPLGSSDRQFADAFEASYLGDFRYRYCTDVLRLDSPPDLALELRRLHGK